MPETSKQEIKLFYCYAREDKALRDELEKHLSSLKRLYALRNWHDREILPGEEWEQAIDTHLNTAHLILLLISPDFMSSNYCYGKEMQRALKRHEEGTCRVIPIILRPTYLEAAPFTNLQMLPTDARPITRWPDRDEAFHDVVKEISLVLKDLLISFKTKKDWLNEGTSLRTLKRYDYALEAFEQALRLDPKYLEAYQEKGMTLLEIERYNSALEAFEQALHLNPNLAALHIAKGQTLNALERHEEALTAFEQALQLDHQLPGAYMGRDKALQQLGISREAQEQLASQLHQTQQQLEDQQKHAEQLASQLAHTRQQRDEAQQQLRLAQKAHEKLTRRLAQQETRARRLATELQKASKPSPIQQKDEFSTVVMPPLTPTQEQPISPAAFPLPDTFVPVPKESMFEMLIEAYNFIREGKITHPDTIFNVAARFRAIADDEEDSKNFPYDAARAANNLYQHAADMQALLSERAGNADSIMLPEWPARQPINDNLIAGG